MQIHSFKNFVGIRLADVAELFGAPKDVIRYHTFKNANLQRDIDYGFLRKDFLFLGPTAIIAAAIDLRITDYSSVLQILSKLTSVDACYKNKYNEITSQISDLRAAYDLMGETLKNICSCKSSSESISDTDIPEFNPTPVKTRESHPKVPKPTVEESERISKVYEKFPDTWDSGMKARFIRKVHRTFAAETGYNFKNAKNEYVKLHHLDPEASSEISSLGIVATDVNSFNGWYNTFLGLLKTCKN